MCKRACPTAPSHPAPRHPQGSGREGRVGVPCSRGKFSLIQGWRVSPVAENSPQGEMTPSWSWALWFSGLSRAPRICIQTWQQCLFTKWPKKGSLWKKEGLGEMLVYARRQKEKTVQEKGEQERGTLWGKGEHFKVLWRRGSSPLSRPTT